MVWLLHEQNLVSIELRRFDSIINCRFWKVLQNKNLDKLELGLEAEAEEKDTVITHAIAETP